MKHKKNVTPKVLVSVFYFILASKVIVVLSFYIFFFELFIKTDIFSEKYLRKAHLNSIRATVYILVIVNNNYNPE